MVEGVTLLVETSSVELALAAYKYALVDRFSSDDIGKKSSKEYNTFMSYAIY